MTAPAIELIGIHKRFGPVHANHDVNLTIPAGTIHGIIGENGAGKSTLMSILYGFYTADSGEIRVNGQPVTIRNSQDALRAGIGMVHQHFMLVDTFTVLENIILGAESGRLLGPSLRQARRTLAQLEHDYGLQVDPDAIVGQLPVGVQQRVEILKALYRGARILILDEPTGVLTPQETEGLFAVLRALRAQGVTVILITHKLKEIMAITDNVAVMRAGTLVAERPTAATSREELAELMVGRKVLLRVAKGPAQPGAALLQVHHLSVFTHGVARLRNVSFSVRAGEIVGIAGVSGNGQSELLEALAGIRPFQNGQVTVKDTIITPNKCRDAHAMRQLGLAHVPEDRLRMGLVKAFAAYESAILGYHDAPDYNGALWLYRRAAQQDCTAQMARFDTRPCNPLLKTANFSGGNQQKIVLARELRHHPDVLLVGQPTRGVDIGAIEFIHQQLVALRDAGKAVLLVSVELDEILSLSDRILVLCGGQLTGTVDAAAANERQLGLLMAGAREVA